MCEVAVKTCARCGVVAPLESFPIRSQEKDGRCPHCYECKRYLSRMRYHAKAQLRRQSAQAWRDKNRELVKEYNRKYAANHREPCNERARMCHRSYLAIQWGKTSPITKKKGFVLVINADGSYRSARLDQPFQRGEVPLCKFMPPLTPDGQWGVSVWPVTPVAYQKEAINITKRKSSKKQ